MNWHYEFISIHHKTKQNSKNRKKMKKHK